LAAEGNSGTVRMHFKKTEGNFVCQQFYSQHAWH